jgi:L-malate glycosyltransferase
LPLTIFIAHPSDLLTDHRPHGDGLLAWSFIRELAARGHELYVAAEQVDLRSDTPSNVHVHVLGSPRLPAAPRRAVYMWRIRRLLTDLQGRMRIDLVHQLNPVDVGITLSLFDLAIPIVLGPYVPDFWLGYWQGPSPAMVHIKRLIRTVQQRRATTLLLSTPAAATKVEVPLRSRVRVRELSPGIDLRRWRYAEEPENGQDILFLGGLYVYKGIFVLLDAFERISDEFPSTRLVIAGAGPEEHEIRRRVARTPALARVRLTGPLDHARVVSVMQACSVYCIPSYGEPFGLGALEAMACGRAVIGTSAGGLQHLIDERGGRKVPAGDVDALAGALRELLGAPEMRHKMGAHNRGVIEHHYAWPHVIGRLEDIYAEAIHVRADS